MIDYKSLTGIQELILRNLAPKRLLRKTLYKKKAGAELGKAQLKQIRNGLYFDLDLVRQISQQKL